MILQKGQFVQIRFNNGIFFDAIIEDWSDQKSIVSLPDTRETVIIQKTLQDVLLVKVFNKSPEIKKKEIEIKEEKDKKLDNVRSEFDKLKDETTSPTSLKKMSELKDEMNKLEREEVFGRMKEFKPDGVREIVYGLPRNLQISGAAQHTNQETPPPNIKFGAELQNLFRKKD